MKKIISALCLCLVAVCALVFAGCEVGGGSSLSYNLEYNVNKLKNLLNKTEEANVSDLIIPEIYSENSNTLQNELPQQDLTTQIVGEEEINSTGSKISARNLEKMAKTNYTPRRASNVSFTNSTYNSYLGKVEGLYVMVNDAVCANEEICSCKDNILAYCQFLSLIAEQLKNKQIELSEEQTQSCNSLLKELSKATNKLTDTRNEVSNNCKSLCQNKSLSNGVDAISSKYVTLVNCLDNRLTNYQNILAILMQLQCVLDGNCSGNLNNLGNIIGNSSTNCPNGNCQGNEANSSANQIADYATKDTWRKTNIDTFNTNTFNPNVMSKNFRNNENNVQANQISSTNQNENTNSSFQQNYEQNNVPFQQFPGVNQAPTQFYGTPNYYGTGYNVPFANGGYGFGGYGGIHNFENGTTNPYRNTDTYKLPPQSSTGFGATTFGGYGLDANAQQTNANLTQKPLPQERRQDFRGFNFAESSINQENFPQTLESHEKVENNSVTLNKESEADATLENNKVDVESPNQDYDDLETTNERVFLETKTSLPESKLQASEEGIQSSFAENEIQTKTFSEYEKVNTNPITEETLKTQEQLAS